MSLASHPNHRNQGEEPSKPCCKEISSAWRGFPSPFVRMAIMEYYDGAVDGIVECGVCLGLFVFRMLDWDDRHRVRVYSLAPAPGTFGDWVDSSDSACHLTTWGPDVDTEFVVWVESVMDASSEVMYLFASPDPLKEIEVWSSTELEQIGKDSLFEGGPPLGVDWFAHLGCTRWKRNK